MAEKEGGPVSFSIVDRDRVKIEFLIDDLIRQIKTEGPITVAACNGCTACSQSIVEGGR